MSDKPIDRNRAETAIHYLANTDELVATLKVDTERADLKVTKIKAAIFTCAEGNIEERRAISINDAETIKAEESYFAMKLKYETLRNRRETAVLVWNHWRSLTSARKEGIVV